MKQILYISNNMQEDSNYLERLRGYFDVEECGIAIDAIIMKLKLCVPDLVIVHLTEFRAQQKMFIDDFRENDKYEKVPIIAFGTKQDYTIIECQRFSPFDVSLYEPIDEQMLMNAICGQLKVEITQDDTLSSAQAVVKDMQKKILIVDDSPVMLRTIKAMLDKDYKVNVATSGVGALTSIGRERPDVVVLDYDMPVCDGRMTLEMIRSDEETKDLRVIFLTAVADGKKIQGLMDLKVQGYLLKPCSKDNIINTIKKVLDE